MVLHWDGTSWTQVDDVGGDCVAIWAASPSDIWIIERMGTAWDETEQRRLLRGQPGAWNEVDYGGQPGELSNGRVPPERMGQPTG